VGWAMANHLAILYAGSHADAAHLREAKGGRPARCQFFNYGTASLGGVDFALRRRHGWRETACSYRQPPRIARSAKRFVDHRPEAVVLTPS
jgi:hypothetical protein